MQNITPEQQAALSTGKMANMCLEHVRPVVESLRENAIEEMKHLVRTGEHSEAKLVGAVSRILSLDDLIDSLKSQFLEAEGIMSQLQE